MAKKSELEILAKLKLKQPKGLKKFIYHETDYQKISLDRRCYRRYGYVEVIEKWRGKLLLRVFAYKNYSQKEKRTYKNIMIQEVNRKLQGYKSFLAGNMSANMSGRTIYFEDELYFGEVKNSWECYGYEMYDKESIIQDLNIPYCSYDLYQKHLTTEIKEYWTNKYKHSIRFFDYICLYLEEPKIELLVKAELDHFITSIRYLDLSQKSLSKIFKVDAKWIPFLHEIDINDLLVIRKMKDLRNLDDLQSLKTFNDYDFIKKYWKFPQTFDYFSDTGNGSKRNRLFSNVSIYNDYLRFAEELGIDLHRNKNLFPENLIKEHNHLEKLINRKKSEKSQKAFTKFFAKHKKHIFKNNEYVIRPVKSEEELIVESKVLSHCVRTYAKQVADGETEILFVRKVSSINVPFVTVEVRNKKIIQVRAKYNGSPPDGVKEFLKDWSRKNKIQCSY
ncbi:hypothetical protein A4S06_05275 [Erysipelotrichaceae bacterium MTC7]|nr:hypothetical protein A4S06_05275 [Erysipelotrichaceae bacterium MTC7]